MITSYEKQRKKSVKFWGDIVDNKLTTPTLPPPAQSSGLERSNGGLQ